MKTKKIKLLIVLAFTLIHSQQNAFSQSSYIKDRWNIQAGYIPDSQKNIKPKSFQFRTSANYGILNFLEVGGYIGVSKYIQFSLPPENSVTESLAPVYGMNINAHLLPFLVKKDDFRFDLYLTMKAGGFYCDGSDKDVFQGAYWQYLLGGGAAFYPFNHLGMFVEYGYENKGVNNGLSHNIMQVGISFKFKN